MASTPAAQLAPEDHRSSFLAQMRRVPGPVAIVAIAVDGDRTGMAATAWDSLCADPPMLLACVNRSASAYSMVTRAKAFSINLLAIDHAETVAIFRLGAGWKAPPASSRMNGSKAASANRDARCDRLVRVRTRWHARLWHSHHPDRAGRVYALPQ